MANPDRPSELATVAGWRVRFGPLAPGRCQRRMSIGRFMMPPGGADHPSTGARRDCFCRRSDCWCDITLQNARVISICAANGVFDYLSVIN